MGETNADVVSSVSRSALAASAQAKMSRTSLDVEIPRNLSAVEMLEKTIADLKASGATENSAQITMAEQRVAELRKDTISGVLVPLKTPEMLMVQGLIAETQMKGREMKFELDVQLYVMWKAENCGTVYFSLRKKDRPTERYFKTQDEILLLDEAVLRELAKSYREAFVLTEDERKNS